jgi:MHS family shikimate/dehydroshikimate transporter-like MFS transporter
LIYRKASGTGLALLPDDAWRKNARRREDQTSFLIELASPPFKRGDEMTSETMTSVTGTGHTSHVKVATASLIGTAIEWYDFFLYGTAAALIFNKLFFPTFDPMVGTLLAFGTYALGFIARPLGGLVFGHYGDKIGRKTMLYLTLLIMGVATAAIGLIPTYDTLGVWAPILLIACRLVQGFGLGGEWGGAVLMAVEHAPENRKGFYGSWPQLGAPLGLVLGTLVFSVVSSFLTDTQLFAWGWRLPFLFSIFLVIVGLWIRFTIAESPEFQKVKDSGEEVKMPILDAIRLYPKNILLAMGARFAENGFFYIYATFVLAYATQSLGMNRQDILNGVLIAAAIESFTIPAFGALSDVVGRRPVYIFGAIFSALMSFPLFMLLATKNPQLGWIAIVLGLAVGHAAMYGPQASFLSELFGTKVRYSGVSLGYNLASIFAGALSPLIATGLMTAYKPETWPISVYMIGLAIITIVSVYFATETRHNAEA